MDLALAPGIYIYALEAGDAKASRRVIISR